MAEKKSNTKTPAKPPRKGKQSPSKGIDPKAEGRNLFMLGHHSQAQIAALLGVTENTVGRWKKEGNWEEIRAARMSGRDESERMILDQIFQINDNAAKAKRPLEYKETLSILNLSKSMSFIKVKNNLSAMVETGISFSTWIVEHYPTEARQIASRWDEFLSHQFHTSK